MTARVFLTFTCLAALLAWPGASVAQEGLFELGERADDPGSPGAEITGRYEIRLNPDALRLGEAGEIVLALPGGDVLARLSPASPRNLNLDDRQAAWAGPLYSRGERAAEGEIFLMRDGNFLQARIAHMGRLFSLRVANGETGILEEYDPEQMIDHPEGVEPPANPPSDKTGDIRPDSNCVDTADRIDVMVTYTPAARDDAAASAGLPAGDPSAIENEIGFAVSQANFALANSNAFHRFNLVFTGAVTYDEPTLGGASTTLLGQLQSSSDMIMDAVHGWRDASKADLVGLVTAGGDCGWGYTPQTANADTTDHLGFIVVRRSCLNANISLAHEFGHNMGALHNRENAGASSLTPPYNFGHRQPVPTDASNTPWRTVMAYNCDGASCIRVTQFSNPDVSFPATNGDPTGVALTETEPEHNVMVFAQNDDAVARYRCARTDLDVANVWGKDTWSDTGLEPDPATAGQSMWRSPYIWVRNQQDPSLQSEHVHENPDIAADPHVYVKLQNDGNLSESGDVELYFASASTNLNNPANWTLLPNPQSATMGTEVRVFEFPWSTLPGTGHYCLLARWNNDGTPLNFTSLDGFVRGDKGAIWRNVNIINTGGDLEEDRVFLVRGDRESRQTYLRIETRPAADLDIPWQELVKATLVIDPDVLPARPELIGMTGANGKFSVPLDGRPKLLGPITLGPRDVAKAALFVEADRGLAKELLAKFGPDPRYVLSIQQVRADAIRDVMRPRPGQVWPAKAVLGGVDYTFSLEAGPS